MGLHQKRLFLQSFVSNEEAINELIEYAENKFVKHSEEVSITHNEPYIEAWQRYANEAQEHGVFETLQQYFNQLKFPIDKGISKTESYRNATLRGQSVMSESRLQLRHPDWLQLKIFESPLIGKVPVIVVPDQDDFYKLVCVFGHKNEPAEIPQSMGAIFINGIYNWDRIHRLKSSWMQQNPMNPNWVSHFKNKVIPYPALFRDKLMILSAKNYSNVGARKLEISESEWKEASLRIRREHECAHLFTLKYYGCMNNNMHDELVADYAGIVSAKGQYDANWFLHFLGLEDYPKYRKGGRLENYQGAEQMSEAAFDGLKTIIKQATDSVEKFDRSLGKIEDSKDLMNRIKSLCEIDLISIALPSGFDMLYNKYHKNQAITIT